MRILSHFPVGLLFIVLMMATAFSPMAAQDQGTEIAQRRNPITEPDEIVRRAQREQAKERNKQRQADLKRDTDKLLELATELKLYVDKTNENVMSLDVIKKASEIEKLSKDIQKKMRAE
jgi:hypothetical protein